MDEYKRIVRDFDAEQKNKKAKQKMRQENKEMMKRKKDDGETEEEKAERKRLKSQYRDRAKERRQFGMDKDYIDSDKVIDHLHLTEEEVKLFKNNNLIENENNDDENDDNEKELQLPQKLSMMPGSLLPNKPNNGVKTYNTEIGREIHKFLSKPIKKTKIETFLPNRCKYQYNLNKEDDEEMYNTIMRSKSECPDPNSYCFVDISEKLLELIKDSVESYGNSKLKKKKKIEEMKQHDEKKNNNKMEEEDYENENKVVIPITQPVPIEDDMFADM